MNGTSNYCLDFLSIEYLTLSSQSIEINYLESIDQGRYIKINLLVDLLFKKVQIKEYK